MVTKALSLRWLHCAGYEIKLPSGQTIVTDPFITMNDFENFTWENIEGADYIMLTHTHGDHTSDVGNLVNKFGSKLFVGQMSCNSIVEYFNLNYSYIWPVVPGDFHVFDDMTVKVLRGKHTDIFRTDYIPTEVHRMPAIGGPEGSYRDCNHFGGMEFLNYAITTSEGLRILIAGGHPEFMGLFEESRKFRPNIVILQCGSSDPVTYAHQAARYQAQFIFPHHHEKIPKKHNMSIAEYCEKVNDEFEHMGCNSRMVDPGKFTWVDIEFNALVRK